MNIIQMPDGSSRKMGRVRPVAHGPGLFMKKYLDLSKLPTAPTVFDYTGNAMAAISQMYLNDTYGCCVISGMGHLIGQFTGNAGQTPIILTDAQIIALYSAIGGFDINNPQATDNGCDEQTALNYWMNTGAPAGSNKIIGWLKIDAGNADQVRAALWLFENLFFGIELPDAWTNVSQSGFTWDADIPNPNNGHCIVAGGALAAGITIETWGMTGTLTWAALAQDVANQASGGELYTILTQEIVNRATTKSASGFDWEQLVSDFDAIGGHVPMPTPPAPSPVPVQPPIPIQPPVPPLPVPPAAPTKDQVIAAVTAAINNLNWPK